MTEIDRPYKCLVDLSLPAPIYAQHLKDVLSVDGELGNKIVKNFSIVGVQSDLNNSEQQHVKAGDDLRVLRIEFAATDAKMLRVAISTTYDMIIVALKCFQEFT